MEARLDVIDGARAHHAAARPAATGDRTPWFCSGCPHNTSTARARGLARRGGIGCHYMAPGWTAAPPPSRRWAAKACPGWARRRSPKDKHIFANLGDGTYFHSGLLAIRQSIAAGVNITYKILYNDAGGDDRRPDRPASGPRATRCCRS